MNDDDIPILTKAVKRERRAELTLTGERRRLIIAEVNAEAQRVLGNLIEQTASDFRESMHKQISDAFQAALPAIIERVIQRHVESFNASGDSD